jgi:hypothetical protein
MQIRIHREPVARRTTNGPRQGTLHEPLARLATIADCTAGHAGAVIGETRKRSPAVSMWEGVWLAGAELRSDAVRNHLDLHEHRHLALDVLPSTPSGAAA